MSWQPPREQIEAELEELGVDSTSSSRQVLSLLATEPHLLYQALSRLGEGTPIAADIPDVDALVATHFTSHYQGCTEPWVLRKTKPMSSQCKRLLGLLIRDLGTPVPLAELLLANGLRSATPRRLRELETEHGAFKIKTSSRDKVQYYSLQSPQPDAESCARYWIRWNLRNSRLGSASRVLAMLSAFVGEIVATRELDYLLPEASSPGKGLARASSGGLSKALGELRARGFKISEAETETEAETGYRLAQLN